MREIKPINHSGSIQLKFSFGGKRYTFNPIPGGQYGEKRDMATAQAIATKILNDILAGHFDPTLDRYRLVPKATISTQPKTLLELWDLWVGSLDLPEYTLANHYRWTRVMIAKSNPGLTDTIWLTKSKVSARTYKDRLSFVRSCCKWGLAKGLIETNPYENIKLRKADSKEIKPFSSQEIKQIIQGFNDLFPHYTDFVIFLLATGVRTSEAIGLRWSHLDFSKGEIIIKESLPKDPNGNGYTRIRKETKTGNIRYLSMPDDLRSLLMSLKPQKVEPDGLVFKTPEGCIIDADNFRSRYWTLVLKQCQIPYRKPYTTRHTMGSHAIEQGIPITGVAYLLGHKNSRMVIETYGHMVNRPELPDIPIS